MSHEYAKTHLFQNNLQYATVIHGAGSNKKHIDVKKHIEREPFTGESEQYKLLPLSFYINY